MQTQDAVAGRLVKVVPVVYAGPAGQPLEEAAQIRVDQVVVDSHRDLPDMFEITFRDRDADVAGLPALAIGTQVIIGGHAPGESAQQQLIAGEVTSIEGVFADVNQTVVRGYTKDHRLQRARRTRTFLNMKDSDVARKIAGEAGLVIGTIEPTRIAHDHIGQVNQTDWDFLLWRARLIGFEFGMSGDRFFFRSAAGRGAAALPLAFPYNLRAFRPRVTAGNLAKQAEVRVWDGLNAKVVSARADTAAGAVELAGATAAKLAGAFPVPPAAPQPRSTNPAVGDLGPDPADTAFVVSDWALPAGTMSASAAAEAVGGLAGHLGDTFAEAHGDATGDPRLTAGQAIEVSGVAAMFCGRWVITRARHEFGEFGYHTRFEVSGRHDRTIMDLVGGGAAGGGAPSITGLVAGIVSDNSDPLHKGRVKVTLPWLSPLFESDWAPVAQAGAGKRSGAVFLPEAGDQVLVGFEFGNPLRPYVIGGLVDNNSGYTAGGEPIKQSGSIAAVVWRGIVSPSGNRLAFHDELPPGNADQPPTSSEVVLGTKNGNMALAIDQVAGTVELRCEPAAPASKAKSGSLTIGCGPQGTINVRTGAGGTVNIDSGGRLNITAEAIKIAAKGAVEITGHPIKLN
jgi:phage protein D